MKQYSKYKQSKFKWINEIPSAWVEGRVSYYFEIGRGRVIAETELVENGLYPVYSSQTKKDGCLGFINTFDFENVMLTWTTDGANAGSVFLRKGKFNCTNVCGTLKPKKELFINYYLYYLQYITQFYKRPDTNGAKIMNNEMAGIHILIPTLQEQTQIALYLDHQTNIIDQLISKKQKLLDLLKEKRQAVINEAVTKGLNPNAKMKDSGIEWLGEINEKWAIKKIKHTTFVKGRIGWQNLRAEDFLEEGPYLVTGTEFKDGLIAWGDCHRVDEERFLMDPYIILQENDVLITKDGSIGKIAIVKNKPEKATLNSGVFVTRPLNEEYTQDYMFWLLNSEVFSHFIDYNKSGATIQHLYQNVFVEFSFPLPSLNEQKTISDYLYLKNNQYRNAEDKIEMIIDNLKEYRQSIISEAVTGKIDVREWNPNTQINS